MNPYLYWFAQLGLDLCSNEFATAKQKFEILKLSVFIKSRIFHPSKNGVYGWGYFNFFLAGQEGIASVKLGSFVCLKRFKY